MSSSHAPGLRRDIRRLGAMLLVLNGMIGAGIFALPARVAADAGALSLWLFPIVGAMFLALALCFAELSSRFDRSGGPVRYCAAAYHPAVGFQAGWLLFLSRTTALAANTGVLLAYLGREFEVLQAPLWKGLGMVGVLLTLIWINVRGVRGAVHTLVSLSLLKVLPLLALVLWGLVHFDPGLLEAQPTASDADLQRATLAVVYAFIGFESVTLTAGETHQAARNIPRALLWTLCGTILLYSGVQLAYLIVAADLPAGDTAPLLAVGEAYFGPTGHYLLFAAALTSLLANLHCSVITAPRLIYAMAEQKQLPAWFARLHPRHATPWTCVLVYGLGGIGLGLYGGFGLLSQASSVSRTLVYLLCALAVPLLRRQMGQASWRLWGGPVLPALAAGICVFLASGATAHVWELLGVLVLVGMVLRWLGRQRVDGDESPQP